MGIRIRSACALIALVAAAGSARANLLTNGGLEANSSYVQPYPYGLSFIAEFPTQNSNALPGWTLTTGGIDIIPSTYWQNTQGNWSVDLIGSPGLGSIRQIIGSTHAATNYTLTFDMSTNPQIINGVDETAIPKIMLVQAWTPVSDGHGGFLMSLAGATLISQQSYTLSVGSRTTTTMQYVSQSFDYRATGPTMLVVEAVVPGNLPNGESASSLYMGAVIDNLDLEAGGTGEPTGGQAVPEPASLAALGAGAAALLLRRRKR